MSFTLLYQLKPTFQIRSAACKHYSLLFKTYLDGMRVHVVHNVVPIEALVRFPVGHVFKTHGKSLVHWGSEVELIVACRQLKKARIEIRLQCKCLGMCSKGVCTGVVRSSSKWPADN